jgi:hypothetical protein
MSGWVETTDQANMFVLGLLPSTQLSREHWQLLKALASFAKSAA